VIEPPPIGKSIRDEDRLNSNLSDSESVERPSGEHVVITPQTAGSAGAAHTSDSPQES
jgi:hypothetical protein